jgi:hypothetical protein
MPLIKNNLLNRWCLAIFIVGASLAIHIPFAVFDSFGEQDGARIGIQAVLSGHSGELEAPNLLPFSAPLYLHSLFYLVKSDWILPPELPRFMAILSLAMSAIFSASFFLFLLEQSRSPLMALTGTLGIQFVPIYWLSSLYGFPTIVALGFLMCSIVLFQYSIQRIDIFPRSLGLISSFIVFLIAVCCKVDMIFGVPIFLVPIWNRVGPRKQKWIYSSALAIAAAIVFLLFNLYAKSLTPWSNSAPSRQWINWFDHFFRGLEMLLTQKNLLTIGTAMGIFTFWVAAAGSAFSFVTRKNIWLVLGALGVSIPVIFFWSLIGGNSARHNLMPAVFLWIPIVAPLATRSPLWRLMWGCVILCLIAVNYFYFPPSSSTVRPSGRLIASISEFNQRVEKHSQQGAKVATLPESRILVITENSLIPYFYFAILSNENLVYVEDIDGVLHMENDGNIKQFVFIDNSESERIEELSKNGYQSIQF